MLPPTSDASLVAIDSDGMLAAKIPPLSRVKSSALTIRLPPFPSPRLLTLIPAPLVIERLVVVTSMPPPLPIAPCPTLLKMPLAN